MEQLSAEAGHAACRLVTAAEHVLGASSEGMPPGAHELEHLIARVKSARTGFPLLQEARPASHIDRLGSVLLGPVFTSDAYPWPMDEDGRPLAPLCQVNTAHMPVQVDELEGLVQVWLPSSDQGATGVLMRLVPAREVSADALAPVIAYPGDIQTLVPDALAWLKDMPFDAKPSRAQFLAERAATLGYASADELADADWDAWCQLDEEYRDTYGDDLVDCYQVTGFGAPRVYCDITEDQKAAVTKLDDLRKTLENSAGAEPDPRLPTLQELGHAWATWQALCGEQAYPCLFGTFQEIQYRALDKGTPFLCFEALAGRDCWDDGGNAQVFYSKARGFEFDWSCF